ncbi:MULTISPECIES: cellulase family glycosylhydrolase [unclassified Coleofasciculus]|uniref:cellulase family glycosylhydrolase n=1 Tax=unclassified Coleofasciculus TaxID=2692782 RepID=UPI001881C0CE|nr:MULTISPECIES: cellulase family glycosylhydrolase [unclassified Coleofasciculus]MBE9126831.1 cellulase family glycosylhydrolase [Coleofasciculus sp. LEGE 07081]MBE9148959.1 cellulase family glycosylhydrolase [Coleofasciculus sp. LEGE 07092]
MFRFLLHPLLIRFQLTRSHNANRQQNREAWQYASRERRFPLKLYSRLLWFGLALLLSLLMGLVLPNQSPVTATSSAITIQVPLSTRRAKIVDAKGQQVLLRGVNWFGIETEMHAPHGLWERDYKEMLAQMKNLGYNTIRLPYSVQSLRASEVTGIDYSIGVNSELEGKSPLEVMDAIIQEADRQGLMILLDSHRLNDQRIPELWYGDGFTEKDWIDTWTMLAKRYKNQLNIIGADLKNEPHGRASWGTNNLATDWRLAAERAGNAILDINPNWLIVVEGVENNVPGQKLEIHWMGANLEGVGRFPVRLSRPNKVVYSPHEYGAGVFDQPWFSEPSFPNNLSKRWEIGWNYIATKGIAPVFIGEFGGRQVGKNSKEGIWQRKLVEFVRQEELGFAYWSWNPNSDDTGGILLDDWLTVDAPKQELLQGLLVATRFSHTPTAAIVNPKPRSSPIAIAPTPKPQPPSTISPTAQPQLKVVSNIRSDWQDGFCMSLQVINPSSSSVRDWQLQFQMNQATINESWNGNFKRQGSQYTGTPLDWGRVIEPGQSRELGFCANKQGSDYQPQQLSAVAINSTSNNQPSVTVPITSPPQLKVASNIHSDWQDGFCLSLQVTNQGNKNVRDWELQFQMDQAAIRQSWNGKFKPQGSQYTVTPLDWGRVIAPGQSRELGFCADKQGSNYQPRQVAVSSR